MATDDERARWARQWDRAAPSADASMRFMDRVLFRDSRAWICRQAGGDVLEVAVGTGLNLWLIERVSVPAMGEHLRRRPADEVALGLPVQRQERFALGVVERLAAGKP